VYNLQRSVFFEVFNVILKLFVDDVLAFEIASRQPYFAKHVICQMDAMMEPLNSIKIVLVLNIFLQHTSLLNLIAQSLCF
jgi:hypothetical protein